MNAKVSPIEIGIDDESRKAIAEGLSQLLADTYTLYLKTHNYHWNVTGPMFRDVHLLTEEQYTELAVAVDDVAERIRTLGYPAPGSYAAYAKLTRIAESEEVPEATQMLADLVKANETVVRTAREVLATAQGANDESSAGLLADRMTVHEKAAWMLRSLL